MKYSELISFNPIEDVIQLVTASDSEKARKYVQNYVMSDTMAENLRPTVIDQLNLDSDMSKHGILVVGNYGTGKSHLMSVISAVSNNADNLPYLQNKKFAEAMKPVAGRFEVLRIEIGGVTMPLRELILEYIKEDFERRGIHYQIPDLNTVKNNRTLIEGFMDEFQKKYPDKGYLIVIDEFLAYLAGRDAHQIVLDLEFFRTLGEMCNRIKLRIMCGVQEKIFDNPRFSFVSDTMMHVRDRFTQIVITKEDTAYVVSERILKKTPEQKARIRGHLEKFCNLYGNMSNKMEQFVDLFPIHPAYIDVFNKLYLIENRHVLKNISLAIRKLFDQDVPVDEPGVISFDDYWATVKDDSMLKTNASIRQVMEASGQLEDIVRRSMPNNMYKPLAIKIIYALSIHRLTAADLDVKFGMTVENMKDDLCLYTKMPEQDADFLLGVVSAAAKAIVTTSVGQHIEHNKENDQYYLVIDDGPNLEEQINQRSALVTPDENNQCFYQIVYNCLEWDKRQYVTGFNIYEHDLMWDSHNIFREGYLFMGLPGERSTAQPERDFYIHIMPPYGKNTPSRNDVDDEVYFVFKGDKTFDENMTKYTAAMLLARISEGKTKDGYTQIALMLRKKLIRYLTENKNTCFDVIYKKEKKKLFEVLQGHDNHDFTFADTINCAASMSLDGYFNTVYPEFPVMKTRITRKNLLDSTRTAFDHFAGRKTQQSTLMLQSFGLLEGDKIRPDGSRYAAYYIDLIKRLPQQGVLNYSDLFEADGLYMQRDKKFRIWNNFTPIIFLSLVYAGYAVITLKNGDTVSAANLDKLPRMNAPDLCEFKYFSKPAQISMAELKTLFEVLDINPVLLDNPNTREDAIAKLLSKAQELCNTAVTLDRKLIDNFELWGEPLVSALNKQRMSMACDAIKNEFSNYSAKFNTWAKLNNFSLTMEQIGELEKQIKLMQYIPQYVTFKTECSAVVSYIASIEYLALDDVIKARIESAKATFRDVRDDIIEHDVTGENAAQRVKAELEQIKSSYADAYFDSHKKKRLNVDEARRKGKIQESQIFTNLRKLQSIDILSGSKFTAIENELANLRVCYELTPEDLRTSSVCPHCHFSLDENSVNVHGQLDAIEDKIESLAEEWSHILLDAISDPLVLNQKQFLNEKQIVVIDEFISTEKLPAKVDDFFVNSILAMLKDYEPVLIPADQLMAKLQQLPPMDENTFRTKVNAIISAYIAGKDAGTVRIIVK